MKTRICRFRCALATCLNGSPQTVIATPTRKSWYGSDVRWCWNGAIRYRFLVQVLALWPQSYQRTFGLIGRHNRQGLSRKECEHDSVHKDKRLLLPGRYQLSRAGNQLQKVSVNVRLFPLDIVADYPAWYSRLKGECVLTLSEFHDCKKTFKGKGM